jgi:sugar phosphate isomerase/epimerase
MYTRRDFGKIALAAVPASSLLAQKKIHSTIGGVLIGAQSYSFREKPLDGVIQGMTEIGLGECELYSPHIEPKGSREDLRKWRLTVPLDEIKALRKKFDDAGINLYAFNLSFNDSFTDEEIDRGFDIAKALRAGVITASATVSSAKRVAPFAEKHNMIVAFHGHSDVKDPNQFARPEAFAQALAMSKKFAINLDIGHFVAANFDPVEYIKAQHEHILVLHLKDRKRDQGPNTPWGQGDTPIKQVLQLLKKEKYPMRALIEYEYKGTSDSVTEVKKCFEYCKEALA